MLAVEEAYHIDLNRDWNPETTLGKVFSMTLKPDQSAG
jgi:hypothetical protein